VVAVDHEHVALALGSCKWTAGVMRSGEKSQLRRLADHLVSLTGNSAHASDPHEPDIYLFSRSGFDRKLVREARDDPKCHLIEVGELFRATRGSSRAS